MDRKAACITLASVCREKAQTEPERQEYWIDESIRWLERAIERSGNTAVSYEVKDGRLIVADEPKGTQCYAIGPGDRPVKRPPEICRVARRAQN